MGQQMKPWRAEDLPAFLSFYSHFGGRAACCGSGYNEVIMAGGSEWNEALPHAIEAFFYEEAGMLEGGVASLRRRRDDFVAHWGPAVGGVPLLKLDRSNFQVPFSEHV